MLFHARPSILRLMVPCILLSLSVLTMIDCFCPFLYPSLALAPTSANHFTHPESYREEKYSSIHQSEHHQLDRIQSSTDIQQFIVFVVELLGSMINFLAAGLFFFVHVFTFSCSKDGYDLDSRSTKCCSVPFPVKSPAGSSRLDRSTTIAYVKFTSFLTSVAGCFASLMIISLKAIQLGQSYSKENSYSTHPDNSTNSKPELRLEYTTLNRSVGLVNSALALVLNLTIVAFMLDQRKAAVALPRWPDTSAIGGQSADPLSTSMIRSSINEEIGFGLRLTRFILSMASILITTGGLAILGCVLELFQITSGQYKPYSLTLQFAKQNVAFTCGSLAIIVGLVSVMAAQCCSAPLEVVLASGSTAYVDSQRFHRPGYLLAIVLAFCLLPCSIAVYALHNLDVVTLVQLEPVVSVDRTRFTVDSDTSLQLVRMGHCLSHVANFFGLMTTLCLLGGILADFYIRTTFCTDSQHKMAGRVTPTRNECRGPVVPIETYEKLDPYVNDGQEDLSRMSKCYSTMPCASDVKRRPLIPGEIVRMQSTTDRQNARQSASEFDVNPQHSRQHSKASSVAVYYNPSSPTNDIRASTLVLRAPDHSDAPQYHLHDSIAYSQSVYSPSVRSIPPNQQLIYTCSSAQSAWAVASTGDQLIHPAFETNCTSVRSHPLMEPCDYMTCAIERPVQPTLIRPDSPATIVRSNSGIYATTSALDPNNPFYSKQTNDDAFFTSV